MQDGLEEMTEMYINGYSTIDIAKEFNVSRRYVYYRLNNMKLWEKKKEMRRQAIQKVKDDYFESVKDILIYKWKQGSCITKLSKEYGISQQRISALVLGEMGSVKRNSLRDATLINEYQNGATQSELACKYGISQARVAYIVRQHLGKQKGRYNRKGSGTKSVSSPSRG